MAGQVKLEVRRRGGRVWLCRVLGDRVVDSLWVPAAEWDAFLAEPTSRSARAGRAAALCAPLMDATDDDLRYIFLAEPELAGRLRTALSGAAKDARVMAATDTPAEREVPWPISNAIACLKEVRDREQDGTERAETVRLSMDYAIEVVRSINKLRPPQPPDPAQEAAKAVRAFCRDLGEAFRSLADGFDRIADGEPQWGDDER